MKRTKVFFTALLLTLLAGSFIHVDADAQSIAGKEKERGAWLGVRLKVEKTETVVDGKKEIKEESKGGAVVDGVVDDSPAEKAGLKKGDVIVNFGDKTIADADELMKAVRESTPGSKVKLTTLRDGKKSSVDVELAEGKAGDKEKRVITRTMRVPNAPRSPMPPTPPMIWHGKSGSYGLSLNTLNKQLAEYFGAPEGKGVLVEKVDEDSDAAKAGFKAGDVILRAGQKTIATVSDFRSVLGAFDPGEKIPVSILRKGSKQTIELTAKAAEKEFSMHGAPGLGGLFRFHSDDDGEFDLEDLEDLDIDIDLDDMEEGVRRMRIMLNGKELELEGLNESLREMMEGMQENLKDIQEDAGEQQERKIKIRAKQI